MANSQNSVPEPGETVKMHIIIDIQAEGEIDTGLTVVQWNSLTQAERDEMIDENWKAMAERDNGGVIIRPEGAQ